MNKIIILLLIGCSLFSEDKPNIIFILSDDQGYADVQWRTKGIPTPALDQLRKTGMEFTAHYGAPTCSPTRAGLLTGRYWSRFNILSPGSLKCMPDKTITIATVLKKAGYRTGLVGKWHLGGVKLPDKKPSKFGFDHTYGCLDGHGHVYTHEYTPGGRGVRGLKTWHRNGKLIEEKGHITDLIGKEAISFITQNKEKPFFLYLPFTAPHELCIEPEEWLSKVTVSKKRKPYAAMITHMDDVIGKVVKTLEDLKIRQKTIIVFASDNGGIRQGINLPLRGTKATVYEGGIRTVALINYPGKIKAASSFSKPLSITDWFPTFCHIAGITPDKNLKLDGINLWPFLTQEKSEYPKRVIYTVGTNGRDYSIHFNGWKLIAKKKGKAELYHIAEDPYEKKNLANSNPQKVIELKKLAEKASKADKDSVCKHVGGNLP